MKTITLLLAVQLLTLSISAQEQPKQDTAKKVVSAEFAKAANLALVAIKNSENTEETSDKLVKAAVNDADAAAISRPETAAMVEIKGFAWNRPLVLRLLQLTADAPDGSPAHDQWIKSMDNLQRQNDCIAAWRLALRNLSGERPKECEEKKQGKE